MATPWSQVQASPAFQQLSADQQQAARAQYFAQVVAPSVPTGDLTKAWGQFTGQSGDIGQIHASMPDTLQSMVSQRIQADAQAARTNEPQRYQQALQQNAQSMPWYQRAIVGMGKAGADTVRGAMELVGANPDSVGLAESPDADKAIMDTGWGKAGDFAGQAMQMAVPVGDAAKGLSFAGKAAPYIEAALRSGAFSGLQPAGSLAQRGVNALEGGAMGAVGAGVSPLLGKLADYATPAFSEAKANAIALARQYGIPLHVSQVSNSRFVKTLGSALNYLPFTGAYGAGRAQQAAFNRAVSQQIGENAPEFTDDLLSGAAQRIGQGYNDLFGRNNVSINDADLQKIGNIIGDAQSLGGADAGNVVNNHAGKIIQQLDSNGTMPGRLFQSIRTDQLNPAIQNANPATAYYLKQLRGVLQDAASRDMGTDDAAQLAKLNGQYNSLKIIQQAINKRVGGAGGDVSPSRLWSLVNGKYGSTPAMRDLAQLGQTVLKDPIADSGTAQRMLMYHTGMGLGGIGASHFVPGALPALGVGALAGRLMNSNLASRTLPYAGRAAITALQQAGRIAPYTLPLIPLQSAAAAAPQQ